MTEPIRTLIIGAGGMARAHVQTMLQVEGSAQIVAVCEPSPLAYDLLADQLTTDGLPVPPNFPDVDRLLREFAGHADAALIVSPHAYHHDQTKACLEAGLDVLLEKPMVINAAEARSLIETRDRTGRLLVVAFQGSLSPQVRTAARMIREQELGRLLNISATVSQAWGPGTVGTWRQAPEIAGGGFLFDTGAHMLNTVADLAGEDFVEVAAWLDNFGRPVETLGVVMARLASGAMVTMNGCGEAPSIVSEIYAFCTGGIIHTGIWGEKLDIQTDGPSMPVDLPPMRGAWEQFVQVMRGEIDNPSPPEVGLRMARLWDAIQHSARKNGAIVPVG
jgi:predicted dehydrogenase